jgi:hypothetical protein
VTSEEKHLLENVLDSLDRLFDRQSSVIDLWALVILCGESLTPKTPDPESLAYRVISLS